MEQPTQETKKETTQQPTQETKKETTQQPTQQTKKETEQEIKTINDIMNDKEKFKQFAQMFINDIQNKEHYHIYTFKEFREILEKNTEIIEAEEYLFYSVYIDGVFNKFMFKFNNTKEAIRLQTIEDLSRLTLINIYIEDSLKYNKNETDLIDIFECRTKALKEITEINKNNNQTSDLINRYFKVFIIMYERYKRNNTRPYNIPDDIMQYQVFEFIELALSFINSCLKDAEQRFKNNVLNDN